MGLLYEGSRNSDLKHSDNEVGLYTEVEENDFDHLQGLAGYTDQVTKKVAQADNTCALKLLRELQHIIWLIWKSQWRIWRT